MKVLLKFTKSLISVIKINFFIINCKRKTPGRKIILFYYPRITLTKKDIPYIEDLFNEVEQNYQVLYAHEMYKFDKKNYFFLRQRFLKLIFGIDLFVSNYLSDKFPQRSLKLYIHHCITDCPLTEDKKELETALRFSNYNYIYLSSDFVVKYFKNLISKFSNSLENSKKNKLIIESIGYPRLDYLSKNSKSIEKKDSIIIAPANFLAYPKHSIINDLENIIKLLLENLDYKIIFRPHPANKILNFNKKNKIDNPVYKIANKFEKNKNFKFDTEDNYLENYFRSACMITDLSGTSFTYSFLTLRPVIFFSPNDDIIQAEYKDFNHFKDRESIGLVTKDYKEIVNKINYVLKEQKFFENSISEIKKKFNYINTSKNEFKKKIYKVLN